MTSAVELENVSKSFGGLKVLDKVSLHAEPGEVTALIGPNGAGKSTLANIVSGFAQAGSGRILLNGEDVTRMAAHKRASRGLGRTFQNLELFADMSVEENVLLGRYRRAGRFRYLHGPRRSDREQARQTLTSLGLEKEAAQQVGSLSFAHAKLMEPARVLAMNPVAIVMDEPAAGLTADTTKQLGKWIKSVTSSGVAILLIEHNMDLIMSIADHIFVLDHGVMIAEGAPADIRTNPLVIEAYLGVGSSNE